MNRNTSHQVHWVEALENRRLLSASIDALVLDPFSSPTALVIAPQARTPSILGSYTGTVDDSINGNGTFSIDIKTQNARGKITGTGTVKFASKHSNTFNFTGKIKGNDFTLDISDGPSFTTGIASHKGRVLTASGPDNNGGTASFKISR